MTSDFRRFLAERGGILCSDASLPTTSYATAEVRDNFMGIPQQYAHTRIYTDIDFTFYVDENYTLLKIFERLDGIYFKWCKYFYGATNKIILS